MNLPVAPNDAEDGGRSSTAAEAPSKRSAPDRAALDRIFGDVLPDLTRDEIDDAATTHQSDSWFLENRPPHHER